MELCAACDAHRPAARAFIRWHRDADRDPKALPQLFQDWETETMHAHGWARAQEPEAPFRLNATSEKSLSPAAVSMASAAERRLTRSPGDLRIRSWSIFNAGCRHLPAAPLRTDMASSQAGGSPSMLSAHRAGNLTKHCPEFAYSEV
jgi:hypothetical protein